jgi:multidrug efflux pump subunit AcrA (membrane-fusion protein)
LDTCRETLDALNAQAAQIQQLEWQVQEAERRVMDRGQSLETTLAGSDEAIQRDLDDFDGVMHQRKEALHRLQRSVSTLAAEVAQARAQTDQLNLKRGQAELLQGQAKQLREQQSATGAALQRKHTLAAPTGISTTGGSTTWNNTAVRSFLASLNNEVGAV